MFTNSVGSAVLVLVNGRVDQEPEPEALQKMKDQARGAVEESKPEEVPIKPVQGRSSE
jgi:hypothetical protein